MDLDDIWDEPLTQSPPHFVPAEDETTTKRHSPAKRRRTSLFLSSGSEGEDDAPANQPTYRARTPKKTVPDIDALFDGIDDDAGDKDDDELAPALDIDKLRRQAEARHARAPSLTPHEIMPSSSPTRELENGAGGKKKQGDGLEGNKKRKIAKLDEARLLGSDGFPALINQAKGFKPRGKGHEVSDLNRLLQMYQFWTHKMYPKATFHDSVQRVEKLCHSKRMHSALGVWRDEHHGLINGCKPEDLNSEDESDSDKEDHGKDAQARQRAPSSGAEPEPERQGHRSSSPIPRPPSSASEFTSGAPDDDFDIDAILREEEEAQKASAASNTSASGGAGASGSTQTAPQSQPSAPADDDEDQTMWDELHAFEDESTPAIKPSNPAPLPVPSAGGNMGMDEDEEMWDVVREMEQEHAAASTQAKSNPVSTTPDTQTGAPKGGLHQRTDVPHSDQQGSQATNDEGWDEMYL
ncbi:uncharacterized protein PHACADRAFT_173471 [Phanerochaete carnosa HHB-10118-sp]|uniref:Chromosome segregation in meiosis protein n=1 Tax=Phanerochaete carnosa (strain HHB-10118-sp) TaxID=650164 RepID=K5W884_PHACS|nr:uncharacterized protein PHACADRAFT_173471 [Phanerochaete carnosa HHB-10118-sp]EKM55360.1 hypothetical protein PHACADRAFT_173471 [Phanerochaete carnosa HHB-10118-sp]